MVKRLIGHSCGLLSTEPRCQEESLDILNMTVSRRVLQKQLDDFESEMRVIASTYVTTERFMKDFLVRAQKISRRAPAEEAEWVSAQIALVLAKFSFKEIKDDKSLR